MVTIASTKYTLAGIPLIFLVIIQLFLRTYLIFFFTSATWQFRDNCSWTDTTSPTSTSDRARRLATNRERATSRRPPRPGSADWLASQLASESVWPLKPPRSERRASLAKGYVGRPARESVWPLKQLRSERRASLAKGYVRRPAGESVWPLKQLRSERRVSLARKVTSGGPRVTSTERSPYQPGSTKPRAPTLDMETRLTHDRLSHQSRIEAETPTDRAARLHDLRTLSSSRLLLKHLHTEQLVCKTCELVSRRGLPPRQARRQQPGVSVTGRHTHTDHHLSLHSLFSTSQLSKPG